MSASLPPVLALVLVGEKEEFDMNKSVKHSINQVAAVRVDLEREFDLTGIGSMFSHVIPPTSFNGRMPENVQNDTQANDDEVYNGAMDTRSYTDLLMSGSQESHDDTPTSEATIHQAHATAKSSQGRIKNFSTEEDILLVSARLNVGMDPILGVDQSQGTFYEKNT
uniref:Uncharacterized protein n=1 Tax=Oryza brachyantha TaxID=4533 RepID=J3MN97_ORYBR